jgi:hypothetical protein
MASEHVLAAELFDDLADGEDELAVERAAFDLHLRGVFEEVLASAGVVAADDVVEVFVDDDDGGAEDDEVEVGYAKGVVEVGLFED